MFLLFKPCLCFQFYFVISIISSKELILTLLQSCHCKPKLNVWVDMLLSFIVVTHVSTVLLSKHIGSAYTSSNLLFTSCNPVLVIIGFSVSHDEQMFRLVLQIHRFLLVFRHHKLLGRFSVCFLQSSVETQVVYLIAWVDLSGRFSLYLQKGLAISNSVLCL